MIEEKIILRKLLEIYHRRSSFVYGKKTNRRVLLRFNNQEFSEYDYTDVEIKSRYNEAVKNLKRQNLISVEWYSEYGEGVLVKEIWLNIIDGLVLPKVYEIAGVEPLADKISLILELIKEGQSTCKVEWANSFFKDAYTALSAKKKLIDFWKNEISTIKDVLRTFSFLPKQGEEITERAFSLKCFKDSKYFEKHIEKHIISIAKKHEPTIKEWLAAGEELGAREILAQIGIVKRNEIYEFCGDIQFALSDKICDFSGFTKGAAISNATLEDISAIQLNNVQRILYIENKTNYEEYIKKYRKDRELVVYHGGFYSPQKAKFFSLLEKGRDKNQTNCMFWADIDLGGFLMFERLKKIVSDLLPYKMFASDYNKFKDNGLTHSESYFKRLIEIKGEEKFSTFSEVIDLILLNERTIEQEIMLSDL